MTIRVFEPKPGSAGVPPFLDVAVRAEEPPALVVELRGELDLFTGPMLQQHLQSYNDPSGSDTRLRSVAYLLGDLTFMDARGLHYLLTAVNGQGPETIAIREPSPSVRRLLEVVGLKAMIET